MNSSPAQAWKESFITQKTNANKNINLGTWVACKQALENAFLISDIPGNAQAKLQTLKQTGRADEYIGQFWILAQWSKITKETVLIKYFMEGLKPKLLEKIYSLQTIPTTIKNWYSHACRFDNQWSWVQEIIGRQCGVQTPICQYVPTLKFTSNLNVMDIDRLSTEKGLCFNCHRTGHKSWECPDKNNRNNQNQNQNQIPKWFNNVKKTRRTTYAMVRSLAQELNKEEKSTFLKLMEQEGFWLSDLSQHLSC